MNVTGWGVAGDVTALRMEIEADLILMPRRASRALVILATGLQSGRDEGMPPPTNVTLISMFITAVRGVGGSVEDVRWLESAGYAPPGTLAVWDERLL